MDTIGKIFKIIIFVILVALLYFAISKAFAGSNTSLGKDIFSSIKDGLQNGYQNISKMLVPRNGA